MRINTPLRFFATVAGAATLCAPLFAQPYPGEARRIDREERRDDRRNGVVAAPPAHPPGMPPPGMPPPGVAPPAVPAAVVAERWRKYEDQRRVDREREMKDFAAWDRAREERARQHRLEEQNTWGTVVNMPAARTELGMHADRMARLNRILDLAEQIGNNGIASRARACMQRENARDARVLEKLRSEGAM